MRACRALEDSDMAKGAVLACQSLPTTQILSPTYEVTPGLICMEAEPG